MKNIIGLVLMSMMSTAAFASTNTYICGDVSGSNGATSPDEGKHFGFLADMQLSITDGGKSIEVMEIEKDKRVFMKNGTDYSSVAFFGFKNKTEQTRKNALDPGKYLFKEKVFRKIYRSENANDAAVWIGVPLRILQGTAVADLKLSSAGTGHDAVLVFDGDTSGGVRYYNCFKGPQASK